MAIYIASSPQIFSGHAEAKQSHFRISGAHSLTGAFVTTLLFALALCGPALAEKPIAADAIADSVGVNVHLHYTDTPYANFTLVRGVLTDLKIRHIRDGALDTTWTEYYKRHNSLGQLGIHCIYVTSPKLSDSFLASFPSRVMSDFEGFEAPNEYNQSGDPQWAAKLADFMPGLYRLAKANRALPNNSVVGPSLTQPGAYPQAAGLQRYFDFANLHNYLAGRNPGTPGWGGGGYGSIDWNLRLASSAWADKPVYSTEIGYNTDPDNKQGIPEDVEGKYMPRLILEQMLHGIRRTYIYELIDVGPRVSKNDAAFGLVRHDGTKKPAYLALKNLMDLTADEHKSPGLEELRYQLSGATGDVHHLLAERSDGSYLLFFWVEEPGFDVNRRQELTVAAKPVTFTSSQRLRGAELYTFSSDGSVKTSRLEAGSAISLRATDSLSVLKLTPAGN